MKISEIFYSIQGEGKNTGDPAVFIRMSDCNLLCGGKGTQKDKKLHDGATWRCDTIEVWRKGEEMSLYQIVEKINNFNPYKWHHKDKQSIRIVLTGGEPMIHQPTFIEFMNYFRTQAIGYEINWEIETNGTITPCSKLIELTKLIEERGDSLIYNVSPKLSNSGMSERLRYFPEKIKHFSKKENHIFKFVIGNMIDFEEIEKDYLPYIDDKSKVYLMPAADNDEDLKIISQKVAEICIESGFKFSNRLHIAIWNQKTGV